MTSFMINIDKVSGELSNMGTIESMLGKYEEQIETVAKEIGNIGGAYGTVRAALKAEASELEQLKSKIKRMNNVLEQSINHYKKAEKEAWPWGDKESFQSEDNASENDSESDYTYSEDNIAVQIESKYLNKEECKKMAARIMKEHGEDGRCNGMTEKRIAKELYAHAVGYYAAETLIDLGIDFDFIQGISESGVVADIGTGDGLDLHYNLLWGPDWFY